MMPVSPVIDGLEPYEVKIGGPDNNQPQYLTLPALRSPDGKVMSRWVLSEEERKQVAEGADICITIWTSGCPYPPTTVQVQRADTGADFFKQHLRLDDALTLRMLNDDLQLAAKVFQEKQEALQSKAKEIFGVPSAEISGSNQASQ